MPGECKSLLFGNIEINADHIIADTIVTSSVARSHGVLGATVTELDGAYWSCDFGLDGYHVATSFDASPLLYRLVLKFGSQRDAIHLSSLAAFELSVGIVHV